MPSASGWGGFRRIEFRRRAAPPPRWRGGASGDHCPPHRRPEPRLGASSQTARWPPKAAGPFCAKSLPMADARPLRRDARPVGRQSEANCSGAEEYEPDHGEDQYRETRGYCQKGKHGRAGLGLTGFSRGFDDLIVFPRCHGALASLGVEKTPVSPCGVTSRKQRLIPDHVPGFRACDVRSPRPVSGADHRAGPARPLATNWSRHG
jgi:hypothetical protein